MSTKAVKETGIPLSWVTAWIQMLSFQQTAQFSAELEFYDFLLK